MLYEGTLGKKELTVEELFTVHYSEHTSQYVYPTEAHPFWECLYVDHGQVAVTAGGEEFITESGFLYLHAPGEVHTQRAEGDSAPRIAVIAFSCSSPHMQQLRRLYVRASAHAKSLIAAILSEAERSLREEEYDSYHRLCVRENAPVGSLQLIVSHIEELLLSLLRQKAVQAPLPEEGRSSDDVYLLLCEYMRQHLDRRLTLEELSRVCGTSVSTVKSIFRERGKSALAYFISLKIERAKTYIREGHYNFTQIASLLGYESIHYFSRQFRKVTGLSPSAYAQSVRAIEKIP